MRDMPTWDVGAVDALYRRDIASFLLNSARQIIAEANAGHAGFGPRQSTVVMGLFWTGHNDVVIERQGPRGGVRVRVVGPTYESPWIRARNGADSEIFAALIQANRLHPCPNLDLPADGVYRRNGSWWKRNAKTGTDCLVRDFEEQQRLEQICGSVVTLSCESLHSLAV